MVICAEVAALETFVISARGVMLEIREDAEALENKLSLLTMGHDTDELSAVLQMQRAFRSVVRTAPPRCVGEDTRGVPSPMSSPLPLFAAFVCLSLTQAWQHRTCLLCKSPLTADAVGGWLGLGGS